MNNIFIDIDYAQIFKHGQKIGGDVYLLSKSPEENHIVSTLSDGLGSGVKANVLASLTAHMAHRLSFSPIDLSHSAQIIMDTLPVCKERKISYSTFTIADIRYADDLEKIDVNLVEYDNPPALRFRGAEPVSWERSKTELQREGAFKKEVISHSMFELEIGDRTLAETYLETAADLDPENLTVASNLAYLYLQDGRFDEAREYLEKARYLSGDDSIVKNLIGEYEKRTGDRIGDLIHEEIVHDDSKDSKEEDDDDDAYAAEIAEIEKDGIPEEDECNCGHHHHH